jgi:hypothetical protein
MLPEKLSPAGNVTIPDFTLTRNLREIFTVLFMVMNVFA